MNQTVFPFYYYCQFNLPRAKVPPDPIAITPSLGSNTSPKPVISNDTEASATNNDAWVGGGSNREGEGDER